MITKECACPRLGEGEGIITRGNDKVEWKHSGQRTGGKGTAHTKGEHGRFLELQVSLNDSSKELEDGGVARDEATELAT